MHEMVLKYKKFVVIKRQASFKTHDSTEYLKKNLT